MLCWPLMSHTKVRGVRKPLHFHQAESLCCLQHFQSPTLLLPQQLSSPWVTMPGSVTELCHRCPPALSASGRNPPAADWVFFLSRNSAIISVNAAGRWSVGAGCLPAGMQPGMQHPWSQLLCASSITLPETGLAPPKVNNSSGKVHSLTRVRICSSTQGPVGSDSHRSHKYLPASLISFIIRVSIYPAYPISLPLQK